MTAVGFLMITLGMIIGIAFGDPDEDTYNVADAIAANALFFGLAIFSIGVSVWLWGVMP